MKEVIKKIISSKLFLEIFLLSIVSGMPFAIMLTSITTYLTKSLISIELVSMFAVIKSPYAFKFLWAPIIDFYELPILYKLYGRRRSWMILTCIINSILLYIISEFNINDNIIVFWIICFIFGFFSATYDISYDAHRIEKLTEDTQSLGAATASLGYKVGCFITGACALYYVSSYGTWNDAFKIFSLLFAISTLLINFIESSKAQKQNIISFKDIILNPIKDLIKINYWFHIFIFILTFKGGQAMINFMSLPYYFYLGYTELQIAHIIKVYGLCMSLLGGLIGGILITKIGVYRGLIYCGLFQAFTDFSFIWLHKQNASQIALYINITFENISGAMGSVAFVGYISSLCNKNYAASHFAILSSIAVFFNNTLTGFAGKIVKNFGWDNFFLFNFVISIPPILIVIYLSNIYRNDNA